jgi:hypothetical protein
MTQLTLVVLGVLCLFLPACGLMWGNQDTEPYRLPKEEVDHAPPSSKVGSGPPADADAVGIWKVPPRQAKELNANPPEKGIYYSAPHTFRYDGKYVTLALSNLHAWEWNSEDGFNRVKAKWVGNDLYWLPPWGNWSKMATFVNGRFEYKYETDEKIVWVYERVGPDQLADYEKPLVKEREPHDYAITARGEYEPGWQSEE